MINAFGGLRLVDPTVDFAPQSDITPELTITSAS